MEVSGLRVALFSGNYNYVRDGANQALNRLAGYILRQGASLRVYSPTTDTPAFPPTGDLVSVPSISIPGRAEYRFATGLSGDALLDLEAYAPNVIHVSSPDVLGHKAIRYAEAHNIPVVASFHTRFETYLRYYGLGFLEGALLGVQRRFYNRCDAVYAPSESMAEFLREQKMGHDIRIWTRGIDQSIFNPTHRDMAWRRSIGLVDDVPVIGFFGRLVLEKGLDIVSDTIALLEKQGVPHQLLIVGEGPARQMVASKHPNAVFTGHLMREELGRAVASMDLFLFPSITETFGNVTLEAMACGLPVVAANATGSRDIISDGVDGRLIEPGNVKAFASAVRAYCEDDDLRRKAGAAGFEKSRAYSWDAVNQVMIDGYLDAVMTHPQRK